MSQKTTSEQKEFLRNFVKDALASEITRIELSLELAGKRLSNFEKKYNVTSDYFIQKMAAEDLEGEDDEYITWAGEYELKKKMELFDFYLLDKGER
ncbi:MAG: hypothetical protein ACE5I1_29600, partial [bacterium]